MTRRSRVVTMIVACFALGSGGGVLAGEVFVVPSPPTTGDYVTSAPVSEAGITPYRIFKEREEDADRGGDRDCKDVGLAFFDDPDHYEASSDRVSYDDQGSPRFNPPDGAPVAFPDWLAVYYDPDDQTLSWEAIGPHGIGAVIVKGGDAANIYVYDPQQDGDTGLGVPQPGVDAPTALNDLAFCWNPEVAEPVDRIRREGQE